MSAARECACAIVSGQNRPNNSHSPSAAVCFVSTLLRIQPAFEQAGIIFLDNDAGGRDRGPIHPEWGLPTRCTYVSHYEENNRSERANYGFIRRDLISGKVPHILSANCRYRIGADFKCK